MEELALSANKFKMEVLPIVHLLSNADTGRSASRVQSYVRTVTLPGKKVSFCSRCLLVNQAAGLFSLWDAVCPVTKSAVENAEFSALMNVGGFFPTKRDAVRPEFKNMIWLDD